MGYSKMMQATQNRMTSLDYLELLLRRKWCVIIPIVVGTTIALAYSYSLPLVYRSSTLIMVEPQKIPAAYVSPTVTGTVQDRLNTIGPEILSRTNLEKIITRFGLHGRQEQEATGLLSRLDQQLRGWAASALQKLGIAFNFDKREEPSPMEMFVERMRKDVDVKVVAGGNAFTVSYIGRDPVTVMQVTNSLA